MSNRCSVGTFPAVPWEALPRQQALMTEEPVHPGPPHLPLRPAPRSSVHRLDDTRPELGPRLRQALKINKRRVSWLRTCTYTMFLSPEGGGSSRGSPMQLCHPDSLPHPPALGFPQLPGPVHLSKPAMAPSQSDEHQT